MSDCSASSSTKTEDAKNRHDRREEMKEEESPSSTEEILKSHVSDLLQRMHVVEEELRTLKEQKDQDALHGNEAVNFAAVMSLLRNNVKRNSINHSFSSGSDAASTNREIINRRAINRRSFQDDSTTTDDREGSGTICEDESIANSITTSNRFLASGKNLLRGSTSTTGNQNGMEDLSAFAPVQRNHSIPENHRIMSKRLSSPSGKNHDSISVITSVAADRDIEQCKGEENWEDDLSIDEATLANAGLGGLFRWLGVRKSGIENTKTIYCYTIATLADALTITNNTDSTTASWKRRKPLTFAFLSLFVLCLQICVLYFVTRESQSPTCTIHTDCQVGYYCDGSNQVYRQPRCMDCLFADSLSHVTATECDDLMGNNTLWTMEDELDQTAIWFHSNSTPYYEGNHVKELKEKYVDCLNLKHCKDTQLATRPYSDVDSIGFIDLTINKLSPDQIAVLLFIAILFGSIITEDLTEAMKEDALLNVISSSNQSMQATFHIIRLFLRIRQIVLPWFMGSATVSVLLTNSLSAKDVVLNFLAVSFFVEADKMVATLILSEEQQAFVDRVIQQETSRVTHEETAICSLIPRLFGLSMSIFVVAVVCNMGKVAHLYCKECNRMNQIYVNFILIGISVFGLAWPILTLVRQKNTAGRYWESARIFILELSRSHAAVVFTAVINFGFTLSGIFKYECFLNKYAKPCFFGVLIFLSFELSRLSASSRFHAYHEHRWCKLVIILYTMIVYTLYVCLAIYCSYLMVHTTPDDMCNNQWAENLMMEFIILTIGIVFMAITNIAIATWNIPENKEEEEVSSHNDTT